MRKKFSTLPDPQKFANIFNYNNKKKFNIVLTTKIVIVKLKQRDFLVTTLFNR